MNIVEQIASLKNEMADAYKKLKKGRRAVSRKAHVKEVIKALNRTLGKNSKNARPEDIYDAALSGSRTCKGVFNEDITEDDKADIIADLKK